MPENEIYAYFRKFVTALILLFTFLLPLKLGGIVGVPEATSLFTDQLPAYLIITWPVFLFPLISGIILVLALIAFPFKNMSFTEDKSLITVFLWIILAFTSLLGIVNATVWDFVIMEITHIFGLAAYVISIYLFLKNVPKAGKMLTFSILAGLAVSVYLGLEQYFVGFKEMQEFVAKQEKSGIAGNGTLKARIFDNRLNAPFTSSNSLAGYLLLTAPLFLVCLWKLCAKIEPPKTARLIFMPLAAACLFFVFFETRARGAFLSLLLAAGTFIVLFPVKKWLRRTVIIAAPLVIIAGAVYIYKFGRGFTSMQVRVDYIWVSLQLLFKHPFAGTGWGDFFYDYMKIKTIQSYEAPHTPHNLFLALGGQAGILALLASLGALFYPLWLGVKKVRQLISGHKYMQEEVALFFGFTAFLFHSMMDINLQIPASIATAAAMLLLLSMSPDEKNEKSKLPRRAAAWVVALTIAAAAIIGSWHLVSSEYVYSRLTDACNLHGKTPEEILTASPESIYQKLEAATKARPYSPFPYSTAGAFYMGTGRLEQAETLYKKALKLAPDCAAFYFRLYTIQKMQGRNAEAEKNLQKAHELFPNHPGYKIPAGSKIR